MKMCMDQTFNVNVQKESSELLSDPCACLRAAWSSMTGACQFSNDKMTSSWLSTRELNQLC